MRSYEVKAKYLGDCLHFEIEAENLKQAREDAKKKGVELFGAFLSSDVKVEIKAVK